MNYIDNDMKYTTIEAEACGYIPCEICSPNLLQVKWDDFVKYIEIEVPEEFSFKQCLVYLNRSDIECLHKIAEEKFYKLLKFEDVYVLIIISMEIKKLRVTFVDDDPVKWVRAQVAKYVWDMFDLTTNLTGFYELAEDDSIIKQLIDKYKGLRIVKINDMFETICWAIIGQQINLKFAYTLKKRLVSIRGVGNWTADYTIMKCFDLNDAFPIADVGIHNALKGILGLDKKPTIDEIEKLSVNWRGWEAYVTFYLWRSLND